MHKKPGPNYVRGGKKRCMGPLHNGEYIPLDKFWVNKRGPRKGRPMSRCSDCLKQQKFGHTISGYVPVGRVLFIFEEIERRVGRAEATRRLGVSYNFYHRLDKKTYRSIQKKTVKRAMELLKEMRAINEVRHKDSINHGAYLRGRKEKIVQRRRDLYRSYGDDEAGPRKRLRALDKSA